MHILIDGDGCPDMDGILEIADAYDCQVTLYIDYAHVSKYLCSTVYCEIGADSVDLMILKHVQKGNIVITQDYGLASLLLTQGAKVLHVSGLQLDARTLDTLLVTRYLSHRQRRIGNHHKGPPKRKKENRKYFLKQLETLIKECKNELGD